MPAVACQTGPTATPTQVRAQYRAVVGPERWTTSDYGWVHALEAELGLATYLLFAMWSREVEMDERYCQGLTGDGGHGHGALQLDDRWHVIPAGFDNDAVAQFRRGGEMIAGLIGLERGDLRRALNRYNSGGTSDAGTAHGNYGPDTINRLGSLLALGPPTTPRKDDDAMAQASVKPLDHELIQFDERPARIILWSENVGDFDPKAAAGKGAWTTALGATVRIAAGDDLKGWLWNEQLWVPPHRVGRLKPEGVTGGINLGVIGPNKCSVSLEYIDGAAMLGLGEDTLVPNETREEMPDGSWVPWRDATAGEVPTGPPTPAKAAAK